MFKLISLCCSHRLIQYCIFHRMGSDIWGMSVVEAQIFFLRSSVLHRWVWYTRDFRWAQREKSRGVRSWDLGGNSLGPCARSISQEELQPLLHLTSETKWCCTFLMVKLTYCELHFIYVQFEHLIQQLEILFGTQSSFQKYRSQNSDFSYHAPHSYSWLSLVMCINCNMRIILRPVYRVMSVFVPA